MLSTGIREQRGKLEARDSRPDTNSTATTSIPFPKVVPFHSPGIQPSVLSEVRLGKALLGEEEEKTGHIPCCVPLLLGRLDHSIREAVMVTKSSKLSRMLPCTAVSFSRKASVNTCSWVHTLMKQSSCMAGAAERAQ